MRTNALALRPRERLAAHAQRGERADARAPEVDGHVERRPAGIAGSCGPDDVGAHARARSRPPRAQFARGPRRARAAARDDRRRRPRGRARAGSASVAPHSSFSAAGRKSLRSRSPEATATRDVRQRLLEPLAALVPTGRIASSTMFAIRGASASGALEVVELEVVVGVGDVQDADVAQRHAQQPVDARTTSTYSWRIPGSPSLVLLMYGCPVRQHARASCCAGRRSVTRCDAATSPGAPNAPGTICSTLRCVSAIISRGRAPPNIGPSDLGERARSGRARLCTESTSRSSAEVVAAARRRRRPPPQSRCDESRTARRTMPIRSALSKRPSARLQRVDRAERLAVEIGVGVQRRS